MVRPIRSEGGGDWSRTDDCSWETSRGYGQVVALLPANCVRPIPARTNVRASYRGCAGWHLASMSSVRRLFCLLVRSRSVAGRFEDRLRLANSPRGRVRNRDLHRTVRSSPPPTCPERGSKGALCQSPSLATRRSRPGHPLCIRPLGGGGPADCAGPRSSRTFGNDELHQDQRNSSRTLAEAAQYARGSVQSGPVNAVNHSLALCRHWCRWSLISASVLRELGPATETHRPLHPIRGRQSRISLISVPVCSSANEPLSFPVPHAAGDPVIPDADENVMTLLPTA